MNDNSIIKMRHEIDELYSMLAKTVDELETRIINPNDGLDLNDMNALAKLMSNKRKEIGISMEDLELQTNLSYSTLNRIFSNPSNTSFSSVIMVLKELGIKSWAEK
ncbi:helix-turn-helix transcriptional regulator [Psychromonas sp. 14N.309.X.WAT.B.A12]|uniref:helix-turn-helix domain-containing protein n=1 Tax=Psychromonas sp. 14N.309.X.WAT.B.A12 TaxID=2998322 RepID=UPI0025B00230|nr:helix-turn-helix transcriptional regulator [Psychromonas sp. 14N.309.X.WAT.B.A12]MDN2662645.1 helix-turn-helix transcriptional regulator [Psychromonas sp. 14N.309.X.WAT.B.A12]